MTHSTTLQTPTPESPKPDRRIQGVANLAIVTMLVLMAQGIYSFVRKPDVIEHTSSTVHLIANDSLVVLREQLARVSTERDAAKALAADRERMMALVAEPIQRATDSSLALQRNGQVMLAGIAERQAANAIARDKLEATKTARYKVLMDRLEDVPTRGDMGSLLRAHQPVLFFPDTPRLSLNAPRVRKGLGLELVLESFVEGAINANGQPVGRGGLRLLLRKQPK